MKYTTPEIEIIELDMIDVIATSTGGENGEGTPDPSNNGLPIL